MKVQTYVAAGMVAGLLAAGTAAMAQTGGSGAGGTGGPGGVDNASKGMTTGPASGNLPPVQPASKEHTGAAGGGSTTGGAGTAGMSDSSEAGASGTGPSGTRR